MQDNNQEIIQKLETLINKHSNLNDFALIDLLTIRNLIRDNNLTQFDKVYEIVSKAINSRFTQFELSHKSGVKQ
ncbi:hypothetical protein XV74_17715 [Vibrio cholerae]|nr:hypothetical protein XV74_17715 [Vibrio cholerae]KQA40701.1 hypothetical protein XV75_17895 [Vibrio cholerae]KQA52841.1 hypothetical protein XV79_17755 [Vibrio cholerae]KQA73179.1 hypothetical protein XV84_13430 [Vibrio cholerae]KQA74460.1 hypothetical protein XV85_17775 [Vibrio cholerae]